MGMPHSPISLLLLKRLSLSLNPKTHHSIFLFRKPIPCLLASKPFSSSPRPPQPQPQPPPNNPSPLSSRLSFVFDQIDAIEKHRAEQDQTLQRIRAWRQSKHTPQQTTVAAAQQDPQVEYADIGSRTHATELTESSADSAGFKRENGAVELVHPWPEWIELMERLVQQNYFDHRRRDEDKMVRELGIDVSDVVGVDGDAVIAFNDFMTVQNACVNFGKDRFDILRSLSRNDIQILVGHGCPSTDRKVVFSGKLLRKRVHLDEGDVCSSCKLRNSCERAFLVTNKEDEARTVDIMRILFIYGFDPLNGSVDNKDLLKQKSVKTVVRKLLHEIVKLSSVPIDPNLSPPIIQKRPPKVKQPPPPPKKRVGRDDVEMKKGDWLCPKCDFMNFAKNTVCLQCDAKRPKRQLLPGEWECPECNFLNYRRNMACFHCECKRPADEFVERKTEERHGMPLGRQKVVNREDVSNAWNFDFDDDESDGADVAAFEYADSTRMDRDTPMGDLADTGHLRGHDDNFNRSRGSQKFNMREANDSGRSSRPGDGFDDFDDEDDIDSYEIDTDRDEKLQRPSAPSYNFSEAGEFSEPEDDNHHGGRGLSSNHHNHQSKHTNRKKPVFSDDDELGFDTDEEVSTTPKWKSSHVASGHSKRSKVPTKKLSFGSDEEFGLDSDMDDDDDDGGSFGPGKRNNSRGGFKSKGRSFMASDSDDGDDDLYSASKGSRGNRRETGASRGGMRQRSNSFDSGDTNKRSRGGHGNDRRFQQEDNKRWGQRNSSERSNKRGGFGKQDDDDDKRWGQRSSSGRSNRQGGFGKQDDNKRWGQRDSSERSNRQGGFGKRSYEKDRKDTDADYGEFRNSRRVIER